MLKIDDNDGYFLTVKLEDGQTKTGTSTSGGLRDVFMFDTFVVKFNDSDYYNQTSNEIHFYENILQDEDKRFFAKLLGHGQTENGETFLVQERVDDCRGIASEWEINTFENLRAKYQLVDMYFYSDSRRNCSFTKNGIKIYDVGVVQNPLW